MALPELQHPADARSAGLRYSLDTTPGITRERRGRGFCYRKPDGSVIRERSELDRIRELAIPPAWTEVWITPDPNGHLQGTGRDARGRKQYRYHARWREVRDAEKYARLAAFGRVLPSIRERVHSDLAQPGLPRRKVLAAVVHLLDTTLIRVGNEQYAQINKSFGATTVRGRHAEVEGARVSFRFKGKSGTLHEVEVVDKRLANVVRRCQELPGQNLFSYLDADDEAVDIDSGDVNAYLRETDDELSTKDVRTWGGTVLADQALRQLPPAAELTEIEQRRAVAEVVREVAAELRNTAAVCRACYIHPVVIGTYLDGETPPRAARLPGLDLEERRTLALLEEQES